MLSYKDSNLPLAIVQDRPGNQIIFYHPEKQTEYERLSGKKYNLSPEDEDIVYSILEGHKEAKYPARYLEYFEKAKDEFKQKLAKEIVVSPPGKLMIIPQEIENQRQFILVTGNSGAGKSFWTAMYMRMYHKMFPHNPIFIISKKDSDPAYDVLDFITRIPLDENFMDLELDTKDFEDSLVIFDDIENIIDKKIKKAVYDLKDNLSETGRSHGIYMILCNHLAMCGQTTRKDNNECDAVVVFKSSSKFHRDNLLKTYVGLDKKQITDVNEIPSRWLFIKKSDPMYVVSENKVMLL